MMSRRHSLPLIPDVFPPEMLAFLGVIHEILYPRQGYTSDVAIISCDAGAFVLKRSQGEQFCGWLGREYRVLQLLMEVDLPVPQPYQYLQRAVDGIPESWLLMSRLRGDPLRIVAQAEQDQAAKQSILYDVGQVLARLHHLSVPALFRSEQQAPWLAEMLQQARYHLQSYDVDGSIELLKQLEEQRLVAIPPTLIHGDFTVDNVLIANGKVSGIVDWAAGAYGDPRYDLALIMRPKEGLFQTEVDRQSFLGGYGTAGLSKLEYEYFVNLYEFF